METEITDIGKVAITPRKDYKNEQTYEWLDVVTYNGASYMCIAEDGCTGIVPTNTDYWQLLADKGHFTEEDKEEFKKAVVEESKTEINEHTGNKKTELNNYTTELEKSLENELDTYKTEKEAQLDLHKATLETEMANKKDSLIKEIEAAQDGFDANVEEKTNTFNSNVETKTTEFNNNSNAKTEEFNNNSTEKINNFNSNAEEKIADYNEHVETLTSRIADLEEETEDLFNALDTEKISGTELYIEDAKPCRVINTEISGMYKQETTAGANLLDTSDMLFNNGTLEQNGLTAKINTDGSIVINGTATANTYFKKSIKNILEDGNYYFYNFNNVTQSNSTYYMLIQGNKSTGYGSTDYYNARGYQTDNFIKDIITYDRTFDCTFVFINGFVANNLILYPEISKTEQTVFEPYTGGNPSPNPDYPQEIMQVEEVKTYVTGKNCYNISNFTANKTIGSFKGHWIYLKPNTKYTISTNMSTNSDGSLSPIIGEPKVSVAYIVVTTNTETNTLDSGTNGVAISNAKSRTVLTGGTGALFVGYRAGQDSIPKMVTKGGYIQIEEGTVATEYEPYKGQTVDIDLKGNKLCAVSDKIKDKLLIDRNGNVALQKNVIKIDISNLNNNSWRLESNNTRLGVYSLNLNVKGNENQICNYFSNYNKYAVSQNSFAVAPDFVRIRNDKKFTTVEDFKNWLQKNNLYAYCEIKNTQLIDLGQIAELPKTFEGINNIWAETNLGNTKIEIEYVQDVKKLLEKQAEQQNARLDNIEALLSTTQTSALLLDNMQEDLEKEVE